MRLERIRVDTNPACELVAGDGALERIGEFTGECPIAVLTDGNVERLHLERLGDLTRAPRFVLPPGESAKCFSQLASVLEFLAETGLDRGSRIVTFGGGVVSDLGGLAASLYMRGIEVIHCPTTLLAQCDAAIGGKTAVNLVAGKNLAGTFHQPRAVLLDPAPLATLEAHEFRSGLGEVLKTAVVGDASLLSRLAAEGQTMRADDAEAMVEIVGACARVKARIVAADEREAGERAKLNLGHTFAHAIERVVGYGTVPHGEAVGLGVLLAARCARRMGIARDGLLEQQVLGVLRAIAIPTSLGELLETRGASADPRELVEAMALDKKGRDGTPRFVLPTGAGELTMDVSVPEQLLLELVS